MNESTLFKFPRQDRGHPKGASVSSLFVRRGNAECRKRCSGPEKRIARRGSENIGLCFPPRVVAPGRLSYPEKK